MLEKTTISGILEDSEVKVQENEFPQDLFETVCEMTTDGLAIIENGRFIWVNEQLCNTFRVKKDYLIGNETLSFVHNEDFEKAKNELSLNRRVVYEARIVRGDGVF